MYTAHVLYFVVHVHVCISYSTKSSGGVFSFFKSLTAGRVITRESMSPVMEKMKEHLISEWVWSFHLIYYYTHIIYSCTLFTAKNVAAEISDKLCESVVTKLNGKTIGTFRGTVHVDCTIHVTTVLVSLSIIILFVHSSIVDSFVYPFI